VILCSTTSPSPRSPPAPNVFNIQDHAGETDFAGTVNLQLGAGNDTLNLAADTNNTGWRHGRRRRSARRVKRSNGGTGVNPQIRGGRRQRVFRRSSGLQPFFMQGTRFHIHIRRRSDRRRHRTAPGPAAAADRAGTAPRSNPSGAETAALLAVMQGPAAGPDRGRGAVAVRGGAEAGARCVARHGEQLHRGPHRPFAPARRPVAAAAPYRIRRRPAPRPGGRRGPGRRRPATGCDGARPRKML